MALYAAVAIASGQLGGCVAWQLGDLEAGRPGSWAAGWLEGRWPLRSGDLWPLWSGGYGGKYKIYFPQWRQRQAAHVQRILGFRRL